MKRWFTILLLLFTVQGFASRKFTSTDKLQNTSASTIQVAQPVTWMAWVYLLSTPGAFESLFLVGDSSSGVFHGYGFGISTNSGFCSPASAPCLDAQLSTNGDNHGGTLSNLTWHHILATYDGATVKAYVDGTSTSTSTSGAISYPNTTATVGNDAFGNVAAVASIAYTSSWSVLLTANEISSLASGANPNCVRKNSLIFYAPIWGTDSTEPDLSGSKINLTVTGTTQNSNPPVNQPCGS